MALSMMGKNDPLMTDALRRLMKRKKFIRSLPKGKRAFTFSQDGLSSWALLYHTFKIYRANSPEIVERLITENEAANCMVADQFEKLDGSDVFAEIKADHEPFKRRLYDPRGMGMIMVGLYAAGWINRKIKKWLGEKNVADILSQSVPFNVTSEMGLALLDVADSVRPYPDVREYLERHASDETFFEGLVLREGGEIVSKVFHSFLDKYGMRCPGEIDLTRTRWHEQPTALLPIILSNIDRFEHGASGLQWENGVRNAMQKEEELIHRLKKLPGGARKAKKFSNMTRRLRHFIGYREYPKYFWVSRYFIYKQALLREADKLVKQGIIQEKHDIYYLTFQELETVVQSQDLDDRIIAERKKKNAFYETLTPPRLITSEGELLFGQYQNDDLPEGALPGNPVSSGVVEGRARVVHTIGDAEIKQGDILVTNSTDPSWTPLFLSVKGLVTEVGGLMTHGAVIAREYGLPAVVGVEQATKQIRDGQKIRVHGTDGYVELLEE